MAHAAAAGNTQVMGSQGTVSNKIKMVKDREGDEISRFF